MTVRKLPLVWVLLAVAAVAQTTTTVTGTIKDLAGNVVTSGQVTFDLQPGADTTISGSGRFVPTTITCLIDGSGQLTGASGSGSCVVTQNTALTPAGTYYLVTLWPDGVPSSKFNWYAVGASQDISTVVPTPGTAPAYSFVSADTTTAYHGTLNGGTLNPAVLSAAVKFGDQFSSEGDCASAFNGAPGVCVLPPDLAAGTPSAVPNLVNFWDFRGTQSLIGNGSAYTPNFLNDTWAGVTVSGSPRIFGAAFQVHATAGTSGCAIGTPACEAVGLFAGAERTAGVRPVWSLNSVTQYADHSNYAMGYEADLNNLGTDASDGQGNLEDGIYVVSGGTAMPLEAIRIGSSGASNYWQEGLHVTHFHTFGLNLSDYASGAVALQSVPPDDTSASELVGRNAANNQNVWSVSNDGNFNTAGLVNAALYQEAGATIVDGGLNFTGASFATNASNPATAGTIRLANVGAIEWRNAAGSGNDVLGVNGDALEWNGAGFAMQGVDVNAANQVVAVHLTNALPVAQGGTGAASLSAAGIATTAQLAGSGSVSTTAASSDSVTITWPDGGSRTPGHCSLAATNASAATNVATSYISAKAPNAVTLTHTATASMSYDVVCTVN
jgi:hypothetical protein